MDESTLGNFCMGGITGEGGKIGELGHQIGKLCLHIGRFEVAKVFSMGYFAQL